MEENQFNKGDIIYLKSGSEPLTIYSVYNESIFYCIWINNKIEISNQGLPFHLFTKEKPKI
jgi:uncharacterized protein YodC (DUF2158 family)